MPDEGDPHVEIFYADPVDEDGNVIGTVTFHSVTSSNGSARATKVPFSELAIDPDAPTIRVREEDFPNG